MELPDQPATHGDVEDRQGPVAGYDHQEQDQQLQPQLGDVPEVESSTTFLGIQIVTLQV